ncbi:MAG: protein kinase domain-containing protein [Bryobacteraceae bacterium]
MPLSAKSRLGPYEILAPIGAGGMGEVYKARDTRLDRIVAVKISAEKFSERFGREARAVAALNHPNICTLHDGGPDYLVMEFIEGQILKGPLPPETALKYAVQICDALDAAHRKGVIHRDLKPANILVSKAGIKLLDFGLAKRSRDTAISEATETNTLTDEHAVLGTLPYMSPEQLESKDADARSDIFSFGVVLYELLTGKRPFTGSSQASLIAAILEREAPSIASVAPGGLDWVLRRCLAKDPDDRWQSVRDVSAALQGIAESANSGVAPRRNAWRDRAGWIAAAALMAALVLFAPWRRPAAPAGPLTRFDVYPPIGYVFSRTNLATIPVPQFALSPDGSALVFAATATAGAKPMLWLRKFGDTTARPLSGTEDAIRPIWSPDSQWIGFFADQKLKKVRAIGSAVQVVADAAQLPVGATWSRDDSILFSSGLEGLLRVPADGGPVMAGPGLDISRMEGAVRWPHFLPDGRHLLFTVRGGPSQRGIYAAALDGKARNRLLGVESSAIYAAPGYLLWVDGDTLRGQAFDNDRLALNRQVFTVAERVGRSTASEGAMSASESGTLAYSGALLRQGRLTWLDRGGNSLSSVGSDGDFVDFRTSPDGKRLAATVIDPKAGTLDIWLTDLTRMNTERLTSGAIVNAAPVWSADGANVLFRTNRSGRMELFQKSSLGGDESSVLSFAAQLAAGSGWPNLVPTDWSPDGRNILTHESSTGSGFDIWLVPIGDNAKPSKFLRSASAADEIHGNFSPDGRFVAYSSNETGKHEVYVQTFPKSGRRWQVSTNGGYEPRWRGDGREIYYLSGERKLTAVPVSAGPSFGVPKALFQTQVPAGVDPFRTHYIASADGQRFLVNTQIAEPSPNPITVVLNWTAGLKK